MGRPPIGKQALTGAERQQRYLARLIAGAVKPQPAAGEAALRQELAQAKQELAQANARAAPAEIEALKDEIAKLKKLWVEDVSSALVEIHDNKLLCGTDFFPDFSDDLETWKPETLAFVREWVENGWTGEEMRWVQYQVENLADALEALEMFKDSDPETYAKLMKTEAGSSQR